jgi:hypothetical protein
MRWGEEGAEANPEMAHGQNRQLKLHGYELSRNHALLLRTYAIVSKMLLHVDL